MTYSPDHAGYEMLHPQSPETSKSGDCSYAADTNTGKVNYSNSSTTSDRPLYCYCTPSHEFVKEGA